MLTLRRQECYILKNQVHAANECEIYVGVFKAQIKSQIVYCICYLLL